MKTYIYLNKTPEGFVKEIAAVNANSYQKAKEKFDEDFDNVSITNIKEFKSDEESTTTLLYGMELIGDLKKLGEEIHKISEELIKLANFSKENPHRAELLTTMECMKLQKIAESLGVFYLD